MSSDDYSQRLARYRQDHILEMLPCLSESRQQALLADISRIDLDEISTLHRAYTSRPPAAKSTGTVLEQAEVLSFYRPEDPAEERKRLHVAGESHLRSGKVALFLVAGGQGTRLGFDGPKGCFPVSPVAKKSLFQLFAESVRALRQRYRHPLPWYIMTSLENNQETLDFFRSQSFFGLGQETINFISQKQIPSFTPDGKLIVGHDNRIFKNPNGHGGSLYALHESGSLRSMAQQGIEDIFYFQVDNPLVHIADPLFIGAHIDRKADMSTKVVQKTDPEERVGIIGKINGRLSCIEYSELTADQSCERLENGRLRFSSANIAVHMINRKFVENLLSSQDFHLPYHFAEKNIDCMKPHDGSLIRETVKGIKCEMFVFDALGFADNSVTLEVSRDEEFAPVKNAKGPDSPETARRALSARYTAWLRHSAPQLQVPQSCIVEVSPLFALSEKEFTEKYSPPEHIPKQLYIE